MSKNDLSIFDGERCPVCDHSTLKVTVKEYETPYFGKTLLYSSLCRNCGFRKSWSYSLETRPPRRYTLSVSEPSDLSSRVIKSSSACVKIPELNFSLESKMASESLITNVEGILQRVKSATITLSSWADSHEKREKIEKILSDVNKAIAGELPFTLILEDPSGLSAIEPIHPKKLKVEKLSLSEPFP